MSEKNIEMMKNFIEAKKNKNANNSNNTSTTPGKAFNAELKARKAFRNRKSGGVFDK